MWTSTLSRWRYVTRGLIWSTALSFDGAWSVEFRHLSFSADSSFFFFFFFHTNFISANLNPKPSVVLVLYAQIKAINSSWFNMFTTFSGSYDDERPKMITSITEEIFPSKQDHPIKIDKPSLSSTPWLRLKDPRIVRVSRAFGGKDRHSKVCTIRGLRDRRVRLSVPTAIQLYDLQHRLGLSQPSKVVDWLLHAAKDEIDELPPLPIQPEFFGQNYQSMLELVSPSAFQSNGELKISNGIANWDASSGLVRPSNFISDVLWRAKSKEVAKEEENERENWRSFKKHSNGSEKQVFLDNQCLPGTFNNNSSSFVHQLEASDPSSSHLDSHLSTQSEHHLHNFNFMQLPPPFSLPTGSQIFICPSGSQWYFPPLPFESDPRQANHLQMMSSTSQSLFTNSLTPSPYPISQSIRPFPFSMAPKLITSPENSDGRPK